MKVLTVGGTANGKPCVFPFVYNENTYYSCINTGEFGPEYWCSTTAAFQGEYGYCQSMLESNRIIKQ